MKCPQCGDETRSATIDSRPWANSVYRKRRCAACDHTYTTVETTTPNVGVWTEINAALKAGRRVQRRAVVKPVETGHLQALLTGGHPTLGSVGEK